METSFGLRRRMLALGVLVLSFVSAMVVPAAAASDLISIPIEQVVRGRPGREILVASAAVPPELVGMQCEMVGETFNQESVHIGNDLLIRLGTQTRIVENFESEENILKEFRDIEEMPARVDVFVRLGPDGVSSGGFLISINCNVTPPTTTTTTTTTSTTTTTTTTTSTTTTTTAAPVTTTTGELATTTTTEPATPTSTEAPSSTTTLILTPPTESTVPTVPATTTTNATAVEGRPELAITGTNGRDLMVLGFGLAMGGLAFVAAGRRRLGDQPTG